MDGFEWLNIPRQSETSGSSTSPAPPQVSFGFTSDLDLSSAQSLHAVVFRSSSSDRINRGADSYRTTPSASSNMLVESIDDESIPLSLTAQEMSLQEAKTYMRWYSDILTRTNSRTITLIDVYSFLVNFRIPDSRKEKISRLFQKHSLSINIGQFFALLRVISHVLLGREPSRRLIKVMAPVPTPPSILSKKRTNDDYRDDDYRYDDTDEQIMNESLNSSLEPNKPLDLDGFTQFMLTGERPDEKVSIKKRSKKLKSVKFSDQIISDIHQESSSRAYSPNITSELDYSLPMDQLLEQVKKQQLQQKPDAEEQEVLQEVESHMGHFKNLHIVDTMSVNGVPASLEVNRPLRPNRTGPNEMAQLLTEPNSIAESPTKQQFLKPNMTGPAQMEQYLHGRENDSNTDFSNYFTTSVSNNDNPIIHNNSVNISNNDEIIFPGLSTTPKISLLSFTTQMTGDTFNNTVQNSHVADSTMNGSNRPNLSNHLSFLNTQRTNHASPSPTRNGLTPPPPVPSRRARSASTPLTSSNFSSFDTGMNGNGANVNTLQGVQIPLDPNQNDRATLLKGTTINSNLNVGRPVPPPPQLGATIFSGSHTNGNPSTTTTTGRQVPPPPPPSRRRVSNAQSPTPPPLPPKVPTNNFTLSPTFGQPSNNSTDSGFNGQNTQTPAQLSIYNPNHSNDSTTEILDDLKALQEEVDKIRYMTGGF
ncbi:uncharacterized protein KQ657_001167 [Scheffersomyces spartinae]|uniref:Protein SCD5 n=1 Tax=Scheffersomyces spartinae TaxID=45513 RepID=A0A9P7V895_9ASCO|nr:uncharacterized protein KQ657_001167 [Scheffersomyces spartinae]KAG7193051.1 hypothetical protein KQ657_001167 [Scheffersomyces spartinae]